MNPAPTRRPSIASAAGCAMLLALLASAAVSQTAPAIPDGAWRPDQPVVLTPPAREASALSAQSFDAGRFAAAYNRAGRPALAVLWNRELTDQLQQGRATRVTLSERDSVQVSGHAAVNAATEFGPRPGTGTALGVGVAAGTSHLGAERRSQTTLERRETVDAQPARAAPAEPVDLQMRAGFIQTLVDAGVRVVDRNTVMRTTAVRATASTPLDAQRVETEALARHAALLVEVLNTRDPAAPTGWSTHLSVRRMADGMVLAQLYVDARPPEGSAAPPPRFEADPKGGFRERVDPVQPADAARTAARQLLARLTSALERP